MIRNCSVTRCQISCCRCCQDVRRCCRQNIFGTLVERTVRHTCSNPDCEDGLEVSSRTSSESWAVLLLESSAREDSSISDLLVRYQTPQAVTLRCETCGSTRRGREQASITGTARALLLGIPRGGDIDEQGLHRHSGAVRCEHKVPAVAGSDFVVTALVEHLAADGDTTESGHFVTWVKDHSCWKRCDDAIVETVSTLPESVHRNVVLAFYSKETTPGDKRHAGSGHALPDGPAEAEPCDAEPGPAAGIADARPTEAPPLRAKHMSDLLPSECDGHSEFEAAVAALLTAYQSGTATGTVQACLEQLQALPLFSCETLDPSLEDKCESLRVAVQDYATQNLVAADAVQVAMPLWRTTFFPLAVLLEAWSRTTGLPAVFYVDSFYALLGSLLNKHVAYDAAGFPCRARCWAVGTASPGSGKSPTLDPLKEALQEVLRENPELAPGTAADGFHVQPVGTHAAAVDRLRSTGGYQFIGAGEGGPVLCPAWPSSATWTQSTHINWQRYLDAATGRKQSLSGLV